MSEEVKGVFVRFPLSEELEEQFDTFYGMSGSLQTAVINLGTPVTGGELKTRAWVRFFNYDQTVSFKFSETAGHDPIVLKSDAQAHIAALEAEVVRLREYYEACEAIFETGVINSTPEMFRRKGRSRESLKGGAA